MGFQRGYNTLSGTVVFSILGNSLSEVSFSSVFSELFTLDDNLSEFMLVLFGKVLQFSEGEVQFSEGEVQFSGEWVQFSGEWVQFSGEWVQFFCSTFCVLTFLSKLFSFMSIIVRPEKSSFEK